MWYGMSWWSVEVSCPICVPSQLPATCSLHTGTAVWAAEKTLTLCKLCWILTKISLCYRHFFQHKSKIQPYTSYCKEKICKLKPAHWKRVLFITLIFSVLWIFLVVENILKPCYMCLSVSLCLSEVLQDAGVFPLLHQVDKVIKHWAPQVVHGVLESCAHHYAG